MGDIGGGGDFGGRVFGLLFLGKRRIILMIDLLIAVGFWFLLRWWDSPYIRPDKGRGK